MKTFKEYLTEKEAPSVDEQRIKQIIKSIQKAFIEKSKSYPKDNPMMLSDSDVAVKFEPTKYPEQYNVIFNKMKARDFNNLYALQYVGNAEHGQPADMNKDLIVAGSAGRQGKVLQDKKSGMFITPDRLGGKPSFLFNMPD
jgi:hypothetical protein